MKFNYHKINQITTPESRHYETPLGDFSSVTTILSATADNEWLQKWKAWVGEAKAEQLRNEAAALGTLIHENLESHLLNLERPKGNNYIRVLARQMADKIITEGLCKVSELWGIEAPLYHPDGYAGTSDLIGLHNDVPAIMDFKNATKLRTLEQINDYICQCVAYMKAHNYLFDTDINKVVIFMVSRKVEFKEYVIEGDDLDFYKHQWDNRVRVFNKLKAAGLEIKRN